MAITVHTSDATVTTLASILPKGTANGFAVWRFCVTAISAGTDRAGYIVTAGFKQTSGTVALVGTPSVISIEDVAGWTATVDVSAGVVRVRVTGAAATEIDWYLHETPGAGCYQPGGVDWTI